MKKLHLTFVILFFFQLTILAQPCLPEGIEFTTQSQIDNFQTAYLNCTEIEGEVQINGQDINNLDGLTVLTSIMGDLIIGEIHHSPDGNPNLTNLLGLENLSTVGGNLVIGQNHILPDLTGLNNITSIEGSLHIYDNDMLNSCIGLDGLISIGGSLAIIQNDTLQSLTGLEGLTKIDSTLSFTANASLIDLSGLDNITSIGGNFEVDLCWAFTDFHGMENLSTIGGDMLIGWNENASWHGNPLLSSLTGLESLSSVDGDLVIASSGSLSNLNGLDNLNHVGKSLRIGGHPSLDSITGLDNLTSIGEELKISNCNNLLSLTGLENVDAESISGLYIYDNYSLSTCHVTSVCKYLADSNGEVEIHDNALGCNSQAEVEEACAQSVDDISIIDNLTIHPNAFSNVITIKFELRQPEILTISIFNHLGVQIKVIKKKKSQGKQQVVWNAEGLPAGIYFCMLKSNDGIQTTRMIKL